jgi:hypothetical protein
MSLSIQGAYGVETLSISNADGSVQEVKGVDIFKLRDELGLIVPAEGETEQALSDKYMAILAKYGVKDTASTIPGIFIARQVVAYRDAIVKKFDAVIQAITAD